MLHFSYSILFFCLLAPVYNSENICAVLCAAEVSEQDLHQIIQAQMWCSGSFTETGAKETVPLLVANPTLSWMLSFLIKKLMGVGGHGRGGNQITNMHSAILPAREFLRCGTRQPLLVLAVSLMRRIQREGFKYYNKMNISKVFYAFAFCFNI